MMVWGAAIINTRAIVEVWVIGVLADEDINKGAIVEVWAIGVLTDKDIVVVGAIVISLKFVVIV